MWSVAAPTRASLPIVTSAAALTLAVLLIDLLTPLGYAEWALYLLPVGLALFQNGARLPYVLAAVCTLCTVVGFYASPPGVDIALAAVNRGVNVVALWALAFAVRQVLLTRERVQRLLWLQRGKAAVSQALLGEQSVEAVGASAPRALCDYLGARLGALYRIDGNQLVLVGGHAVDAAALPATLPLQHGLLGEALRTGRGALTTQVPAGHLPLVSALGRSDPQRLLVAPITAEGHVIAALELGFTDGDGVDDAEVQQLMGEVGEAVGMALRSAVYRQRLVELLGQTQRQSAELQAQQEELRVSNEELEEQSRALEQSQAQLEQQQQDLEQTNVRLEERTEALERQKARLQTAQRELQATAAQLEAASRYKSEFLANMSHELRTPLNSSLILSKLLADNREETLTEEQVRYAQSIQASNNDLLALINDILDLSKIEAGHLQVTPEPVLLAELLATLRTAFEPLVAQKGLRFTVEAAPGAPERLVTDAQRLRQVLKNLLGNAVKFTEAGEVALRVAAAGERVRFEVRDTGIGIAKSQHEVIFEAFRQADGSTSRRYGGTGLGLSISRELARRLGGEIDVDSEPGRGSVFTLTLPRELAAEADGATAPRPAPPPPVPVTAAAPVRAAAPAPPPVPDDDRAEPHRRGRLILAVEDDTAFAAVLVELAHEMHFDCVVAPTAADALRLARELKPSAVLLDVALPDASGLSVLEQLKRDAATRHVPVHMMSAHDRQRTALELGAIGYVVKPAAREELQQAVARLEQRLQQQVRRVLVVEDDAALRENLKLLLGGERTEVAAVGRVADALEQLAATTFDCMVMDLSLPDGSGYELLERMAQGEQVAFPPVIVYTGRALTRDEEQRLRRYSRSIIIKGARSPERLLDEVTLFLHSVEAQLPADQQRMLKQARRRDAVLDGRRLLLAEDDVRNIFALSSVFEPLGVTLEIARNGREALERLERQDIDLVLMDVMMPEMDGLEAMRRIRARPEWQQLPIIALTAKAMADDRDRCLQAGANDYIAKPIDVEKLVSLTRVWCPK
jgi:CheY-like chemotaxis protein/signal transduction histidine kinase